MNVVIGAFLKKTHNLPKNVAIEASLAHKRYEEQFDRFCENEEKDESKMI